MQKWLADSSDCFVQNGAVKRLFIFYDKNLVLSYQILILITSIKYKISFVITLCSIHFQISAISIVFFSKKSEMFSAYRRMRGNCSRLVWIYSTDLLYCGSDLIDFIIAGVEWSGVIIMNEFLAWPTTQRVEMRDRCWIGLVRTGQDRGVSPRPTQTSRWRRTQTCERGYLFIWVEQKNGVCVEKNDFHYTSSVYINLFKKYMNLMFILYKDLVFVGWKFAEFIRHVRQNMFKRMHRLEHILGR